MTSSPEANSTRPGRVSTPGFEITGDTLTVRNEGNLLPVSLKCPIFFFGEEFFGSNNAPLSIRGIILGEEPLEITFEPAPLDDETSLEVKLFIEWSPREGILRKWAAFRINHGGQERTLKEITLESLSLANEMRMEFDPRPSYGIYPGQSYPAFFRGFFAGIEFPVSGTRLEGGKLVLTHRPGLRLAAGRWYESRRAVFGICPVGQEKAAFAAYLAFHHPVPAHFHVSYNNWWTSPVPYTEDNILDLMEALKVNLYDRHGIALDFFCLDMGWSDDLSIWEIDVRRFSDGFARLSAMAASMESGLALCISPGGCYDQALNNNWAKSQGYEAADTILPGSESLKVPFVCLGGERYQSEFLKNIQKVVKDYQIKQVKLDGLFLECNEKDHGHVTGAYSCEAIAEGAIAAFKALRESAPDTWAESTCFGWNPSPWWLFYVDSVIGAYGTDAPYGRVPCPIYRESYTTARDFFNLQGAVRIAAPFATQEVLGIVHQTPDDFTNDAVVTVLRGHAFLPVYINPKYMNPGRWERLAGLLHWARANEALLKKTEALLPASWSQDLTDFSNDAEMPREPYGYAHWEYEEGKSLVVLRNPWIKPARYGLTLPASEENPGQKRALQVTSVYPENRVYQRDGRPGEMIDVPLAPYETIVLTFERSLPPGAEVNGWHGNQRYLKIDGPIDTQIETSQTAKICLSLSCTIENDASRAALLVILEGDESLSQPDYDARIDGSNSTATIIRSQEGWAMSTLPGIENWLVLQTIFPPGKHYIRFKLVLDPAYQKVSAWVLATKPGQPFSIKTADGLPQPEQISLDAVALLEPESYETGRALW